MKIDSKKLKYYVVRLGIVFVSAYLALFLAEIILWRMETKTYSEMYHDLYIVRDGRAVLRPGYNGRFDIGGVPVETHVNSYGYRGHEPSPNPKSRVLLIGDSFTFGALLDQKETIDARMEEKEPGLEVDNLGVIAYNLPQQLAAMRDCTLPANQAVYLFFYNDLERPLPEMTTLNGYLVLREHADGTPLSDSEARAASERAAKRVDDSHPFSPWSSIRLFRLRQVARNAYLRFRNPHSSETTNWWPREKDQTILVPRSLAYTREMRDLAVQRNMKFQIAIAPSVDEVRDGKHLQLVADYIAGLKAAGIPVIDLLPKLSADDYWSFDPHFNAKGAKIAADEIYKAIKEPNPQVP